MLRLQGHFIIVFHFFLVYYRIANQRIMELEAQVEDIHENQKTVSSEEVVEIKKKLNEQIQRTQEKDLALSKIKDLQDELERKYSSQSQKVQELQDLLNKKDNEMKLMEARYSKYLDKARAVRLCLYVCLSVHLFVCV